MQNNNLLTTASRHGVRATNILASPITVILALVLFATTSKAAGTSENKLTAEPVAARNEELTSAAWKALDLDNFREAIAKADKCIEAFEASALKIQKQLESAGTRVPKGDVTEEEKKAVHQNGLLNDVATCYFIKGKSFEGLKQKQSAIIAYKATARFTHARTWDPKGWFWSPAEAATERLEELR